MKNKKFFIIALLMVVVLIGVGYANITNRTLEINGTATASPDNANFIVRFVDEDEKENVIVTEGGATAKVIDNDSAEFTVTGLTAKGQSASATYTIVNESKGLDAFLSADVITNTNPDDFFVTYFIDNPTLKAGNETRIKVLVILKNTPIDENLSTTIKVDLTAEPQQPTEEPEYPTEEPPAEENYPAEEG